MGEKILDDILGKEVTVFFDDGESIKRKEGRVINLNKYFIYLWLNPDDYRRKSRYEAINVNRIIRMEVHGE